jgi:hypothetical protein
MDRWGSNGINLPTFLWRAHVQSGFRESNGQMQQSSLSTVAFHPGPSRWNMFSLWYVFALSSNADYCMSNAKESLAENAASPLAVG